MVLEYNIKSEMALLDSISQFYYMLWSWYSSLCYSSLLSFGKIAICLENVRRSFLLKTMLSSPHETGIAFRDVLDELWERIEHFPIRY